MGDAPSLSRLPDCKDRRQANLVIDLLDPHALSLQDAPAKAAGLAEYAKKDASSFGRIELIIVDGGKMKRLDLSDEGHRGPSKIRWRADTDKLRRTSVVPAPHPGVGSVPIFPHPKQRRHPGGPVTRHLAAYWLKQAYELSGVPKLDRSLWHAFRRQWASERKNLPVKDVAAARGWKDVTTLINCYQQPDEETMRSVVEYERPRIQTQVRTAVASK
jgi:hypothetical protein